ncbi:hypothetical protein V7O62_09090 [Methanolobus sp. ZRKC2]|uniref:hypothetical protein n=1 Tax=Methanolobus sp. ZRKC2 TaxID=3125783 RepID=UPI0032453150
MEEVNELGKLLRNTSLNAFIGWVLVSLLFLAGITNLMQGRLAWFILIVFVICAITAPAMLLREPSVMPSWYFIVIAIMPIIGGTTAYYFFSTGIPAYFSVATIALLLAAEINRFTFVHMNYKFAIVLVVITTLAISGLWHLLRWVIDIVFGTAFLLDGRSPEAINSAMMHEFIYATIAGIAAGILFGLYFRSIGSDSSAELPQQEHIKKYEYPARETSQPIQNFLGLSSEKQKLAIRIMQGGLLVLLIVGMLQRDIPTALNAITGLAITFIPYFITRKFDIPHYTGLTLWITLAIFLHSIGTFAFYESIARWDNITHVLSASIVATAGYTIIRAIDIYSNDIFIPPKVLFLFILLFVLATGVLWEIFEFLSGGISSELGYEAVLAQHGINDTMVDLLFNLLGAILAAAWATVYLSDISYRLADKFEEMSGRRTK